MLDSYGREIDYLRISVTDACNMHCIYCNPLQEDMSGKCGSELFCKKEFDTYKTSSYDTDRKSEPRLLTDSEIIRITKAASQLGIRHIRLTGGEPLMREGIAGLINELKHIENIETVSLTTNGILLETMAGELSEAGLDGVNVSLDALDDDIFGSVTGSEYTPAQVLAGIDAALKAGMKTKINCVPTQKNVGECVKIAALAKDKNVDVRFIELMPVGYGASETGIPNSEILEILDRAINISGDVSPAMGKKSPGKHGNGPAVYYNIPGFAGSIGFISAIHDRFCASCNRIRLTSDGYLKGCLCFANGIDLKDMIRNNGSDDEIRDAIIATVEGKPAAHCFETPEKITEKRSMQTVGG